MTASDHWRKSPLYLTVLLFFLAGVLLSIVGVELSETLKGSWYVFFAKLIEHSGYIIGVVAVLSLISEHLAHLTIVEQFSNEVAQKIGSSGILVGKK
jgi:hypothetical protein